MTPTAPLDEWTGLEAARFAVYLHFPWCLSKCPYCDFASIAARVVPEERYTRAILREVDQRTAPLAGRTVDAVFIGGGTPSLWAPKLVGQVLEALDARLPFASRCEVTLEANPGAADASRFEGYRAAGVNRLSMGVQSFEPETLQALGRAHDGEMARRAYAAARAAGFENVSLDFIYGVQGQSLAQVTRDARTAVSLGANHLSAYALTLDRESLAEDVPLARQLARGEVTLPPDDEVVAMQRVVRDTYRAAGLHRYEVSNYAQAGYHSRHNATYWTQGEYLALGTGATGFLREGAQAFRYSNHRSGERYLQALEAGEGAEASREPLTARELFEERVAMGLRLVNGVDLQAVCEAFGERFEARALTVKHLLGAGLLVADGPRLRLTDEGLDVHSAIAARLM